MTGLKKISRRRDVLDRRYPDTPVVLTRIDGHAVLVNEAAMKEVGVTSASEFKAEQSFVRLKIVN
ncbi:MAG: hypothetical protein U5L09_00530 [Bacteroidales bacterium]|nr:hypothetical protein [Bacteroidales bacterium]